MTKGKEQVETVEQRAGRVAASEGEGGDPVDPAPAAPRRSAGSKSAPGPNEETQRRKARRAEGKITVRLRQVRSEIGSPRRHREVLTGLGLRGIHHEVERQDTPATRGAVAKVAYLVKIVEE